MNNEGYISIVAMAVRDGVPVRVLKRYALGGIVRGARGVRHEMPVLRKGEYVIEQGVVKIREDIFFIRGKKEVKCTG